MQAAIALVGHKGLLGVTATDLAVLEGSKPRATRRRYMVDRIMKIPSSKEVGVRILIGFIARIAAMLDKSIEPVLAYSHRHYVRVFLLVERGSSKADKMLKQNIGCVKYMDKVGYVSMLDWDECVYGKGDSIAPIWTGKIFNRIFVEKALKLASEEYFYMDSIGEAVKLLKLILEEEPLQGYIHQRIDALASKAKTSMPRRDLLIRYINDRGYRASRTHFSPIGFRTSAPVDQVIDAIRATQL